MSLPSLKKGERRARPFTRTREDHLLETAEDYTELVADLIELEGEARIGTMADALGVSHVTVLRTVRRLQEEGFLLREQHQPVTLSEKGRDVAEASKQRHEILRRFLVKIGVPPEQAEIDTEGIEHHVSPVTLRCIESFLKELG